MDKIAKVLVDDYKGAPGRARLFRLSEPLDGYNEVLIWLQDSIGPMGPEVNVVGTNLITGRPKLGFPLPGSCKLQHMVDFEDACVWALATAGGYEVVGPDPVVDNSPAEVDEPTILESEVAKPIRVHTLAKELDTTSAELLETLADHGHDVTSASANVNPDVADIMRGIYGKGN